MKNLFSVMIVGLLLLVFGSPAVSKIIDGQQYKKVIVVAPQGGDFTDVVEAYNSIGETSEKDRVLISIKPGIYYMSTSLLMTKNYVDIQGSGPDVTILKRNTLDMNYSTFYMIENGALSEIKDLSLELTAGVTPYGEYYVVGVQLAGGQPQALRNVRISVDDTGAARQVTGGIDIRNRAKVQLENVTIMVKSATAKWYFGLFSDGDVLANNLRVVSYGTYGVFAGYGGANLTLNNAVVTAYNGMGLESMGGGVTAADSYIEGGINALSFNATGMMASITNSTLIGPIWENALATNTISIVDCVDGAGNPIVYP